MPKKPATQKQLSLELRDLRARLDEANETLRAIRSGGADALVVSGAGGEQVFTLTGADHPYRVLIEDMSEGALTLTLDGVILYANRRFAEMLKTPLEKVIGSAIHTWMAPDSQLILKSLLRKSVDKKRREQLILTASDGTLVQVNLSVSNLRINGMPDSFCLVATDLTEQIRSGAIVASEKLARELLAASSQSRLALLSVIEDLKRAEEELRESERGLKDAQSLGRLGSWGFDIESQVITWSDQLYQLYERDPVLGPPTLEEEAAFYSPEQVQILREYSARAIKEGQSFEYDLKVNLPTGKHLSFSAKMQPVRDANGRVVRLFGTILDVTELKRAEEELTIVNKELIFQNEEKEQRAAELIIANKELVYQNEEKEKRAAELIIANKELVYQNEEKEKRAA
ncbi:MAG: PAS domain S-box protein, partial [Candidatus Atribacteria bacterium]|nr:PAS domain S-box protein [Candidatus Atribacteria bacterium]